MGFSIILYALTIFACMDKQYTNINLRPKSRFPIRLIIRIILIISVIVLVLVSYGFVRAYFDEHKDTPESTDTPTTDNSLTRGLKRLVFSDNRLLDGFKENRINVLLLGVGGEGHDGPQLSDTIILASFRPSDNAVALLSIPRDLAVTIPGYGVRKINHANAYGEEKNPGKGGELARDVVSAVLDEPIHYWLRVDFSAFEKIIDLLGGLSINVEHSFIDSQYPTNDFLTQTVEFTEGVELMDGKRALIYARSRHGNNNEGTDFARARRQQKILTSIRDSILTPSTLANPKKINSLFNTISEHIDTDISLIEMLEFGRRASTINFNSIVFQVLEAGTNDYLQEISNTYGYFLVPRAGDFSEIAELANTIFDKKTTSLEKTPQKITPKIVHTTSTIAILNGTWEVGLAARVRTLLEHKGIHVREIGNAPERGQLETTVYVRNTTIYPETTTSTLATLLNATITNNPPPFTVPQKSDMVIVIGRDFLKNYDTLKNNSDN